MKNNAKQELCSSADKRAVAMQWVYEVQKRIMYIILYKKTTKGSNSLLYHSCSLPVHRAVADSGV